MKEATSIRQLAFAVSLLFFSQQTFPSLAFAELTFIENEDHSGTPAFSLDAQVNPQVASADSEPDSKDPSSMPTLEEMDNPLSPASDSAITGQNQITQTTTISDDQAATPGGEVKPDPVQPLIDFFQNAKASGQSFAATLIHQFNLEALKELAKQAWEFAVAIFKGVAQETALIFTSFEKEEIKAPVSLKAYLDSLGLQEDEIKLYHTHPQGDVAPSGTDFENLYPGEQIARLDPEGELTFTSLDPQGGVTTQLANEGTFEEAIAHLKTLGLDEEESLKDLTQQVNLYSQDPTLLEVFRRGDEPYFITPYDKIPNFTFNRTTHTAVRSGNWSDASIWAGGQIPLDGAVVKIASGVTVIYDLQSDAKLDTVGVEGTLRFRTDVNTRMVVKNLEVAEGGYLEVGTAANPVLASVKAEIIFADLPLDTTNDPEQYGNGLIALGKVTMYGAVKSETFVRPAVEPKAGDTTLTLSQPVTGWRAGDRLVLPDTRQPTPGDIQPSQWEVLTLASVSADGTVLTLSSPLLYNHLGARDGNGVLNFLPDMGNLSRNVVVRSANPSGTRGYALFTSRADIDIRYTQFGGLGRTRNDQFDNTTFDINGAVTHLGTNQQGRYPVTFNHVLGPVTTPADGYQYTFVGNTVSCPLNPMPFRWGIDINGSNYGWIKDNVLYNWAGAGIVTEEGSESFNVIEHNFVVRINGTGWRADTGGADVGREGSAFWFHGPNNYVSNNVAANMITPGYAYGYTYFNAGVVRVPNFKGADTSVAGQYTLMDMQATPLLQFAGNTVYGTGDGLTIWFLGASYTSTNPIGQSLVQDFHAWHVQTGFFAYPINNVTFNGYVVRGDFNYLPFDTVNSQGIYVVDYLTANFTIQDSDIQGMRYGIMVPSKVGDTRQTGLTPQTYTIQNSYLRNYYNIYAETMSAVTGGGPNLAPRKVIISNVKFDRALATDIPGEPQLNIFLNFLTSGRANFNWIQDDEFYAYNYNQVAGDNFQVYWNEQAPDFIVPQTSSAGVGSPETGLTNQRNWTQYGIAIAGAVVPCTDLTCSNALLHPEIRGLVFSLGPIPLPPDTTSLVISAVSISNLTSSGATISWTTDEASDSQIEYGTTTAYGSSTTLDSLLVTSHSVTLNNLTANTLYHYRTKSKDASGNLTVSSDFTLTTLTSTSTSNHPPVMNAVAAQSINEGQTLTFTVTATDPDPNQTLTLSANGLPAGSSFDPLKGIFSWTPDYTQAGSYSVTFNVTDGTLTATQTVAITVANVDRAPVLNPISNQIVEATTLLSFTLSATDPDNDPLTYSVSGLPSGATFDAATRTFQWTPTLAQVGTYVVNFSVTDGSLTASLPVSITVQDTTAPSITSLSISSTDKTGTIAVASFSTSEPSTITSVQLSTDLSQWSTVDSSAVTYKNPTSGTIKLTNLVTGTFYLRLTATDASGNTSTYTYQVTKKKRGQKYSFIVQLL